MTTENPLPITPEIAAVSVRSLSAGYADRMILENISFDVPRGQILAILGTSGCGKSTLLKHIIGLYKPLSGDILLEGKSIVRAAPSEKRQMTMRFGVAYQSGALFRSMSVFDNVALPLREHTELDETTISTRVKAKLAMVQLDGFEDFMPSDLSGGMIKRAAFARAMALDPELLFFDEPSAGLDPVSSAALDALMLDIRAQTGATILIVTHELASIFAIADRAIMLDKTTKNIAADGDPHELKEHSTVPLVRDFLNRRMPPRGRADQMEGH